MESLTRLVTESLARYGFDRPLDYRRLRWSRWFRCESHHSLLLVPSKPGVFALAEEIVPFDEDTNRESHALSRAEEPPKVNTASAAEGRRLLAVTEFFEADDMAFVLDRMLARPNPLREALNSGRYFVRFVVIEDEAQRRSVCASLNQWIADASDKAIGLSPENASGIASHFATSLELTPATEYVPAAQASLFENANVARTLPSTGSGQVSSANASIGKNPGEAARSATVAAQPMNSGSATNIHCPSALPSGF